MKASNVAVAGHSIRRKLGSMRFSSLHCSINVFYSLDLNNVLASCSSKYWSDILISFVVLKQGAVNNFLRLADLRCINKPIDHYMSKLCWRNLEHCILNILFHTVPTAKNFTIQGNS